MPLGLLDRGASAGLNLLLDQWAYSYTPHGPQYGDPRRQVLVEARARGDTLPPLGPLQIGSRIGIDLHPIDVHDDKAVRWLMACIWPEQPTRFQRLKGAIDVARREPPHVIGGDIVELLPSVAAAIPGEEHLSVQNSWVLNYVPEDERRRLVSVLDDIGAVRDLSWVSVESPELTSGLDYPLRPDASAERGATVAVLSTWRSGRKDVRRLADCHPHGTWLRWW